MVKRSRKKLTHSLALIVFYREDVSVESFEGVDQVSERVFGSVEDIHEERVRISVLDFAGLLGHSSAVIGDVHLHQSDQRNAVVDLHVESLAERLSIGTQVIENAFGQDFLICIVKNHHRLRSIRVFGPIGLIIEVDDGQKVA